MLKLTDKPWAWRSRRQCQNLAEPSSWPSGNTVLLEIRRHLGQIADRSYRIEFNPRKSGTSGMRKIMRVTSGAHIGFDPEKLVANAYVTRRCSLPAVCR